MHFCFGGGGGGKYTLPVETLKCETTISLSVISFYERIRVRTINSASINRRVGRAARTNVSPSHVSSEMLSPPCQVLSILLETSAAPLALDYS